ncbi:MAG: PBP1A family penicillin-binding protein [Deltaproteobacteria bacterium]|nr:PBP1A family penicillin-binding protein [Deltaproteobacteria bacterium]
MTRFLKVALVLSLSGGSLLFFVITFAVFYYSRSLPTIAQIEDYRPNIVAQVYGDEGTPIGEFWKSERRLLADVEEIPPLLIGAFLAVEDARFFGHHGVDFRGTLRAMIVNWRAGDIVQGGSTITQQLTRSLLLSNERTYVRKIKEAILATRLERMLSKEEILYLYLNQIYFGNRAWGVKAAAQNYFHKELSELNLAEMAILAGLPKAPESYSPLRHPDKARERQQTVLQRLEEENYIEEKELSEALTKKVLVYHQGTDKEANEAVAPHFMEHLRKILLEKYGDDVLYKSGLKIHTPINVKMQLAAQTAVGRGTTVIDRRRRRWRSTTGHVEPEQIAAQREEMHKELLSPAKQDPFVFPPLDQETTPILPNKNYSAIVLRFEGNDTIVAIGKSEAKIPRQDLRFDDNLYYYDTAFYFDNPAKSLKVGDIVSVKTDENLNLTFYQKPKIEGAFYAQENETGAIKAVVGGTDFSKSEFNRAFLAVRQPGSSFKPFVYAAALDKGYTFRTPLLDTPFFIPIGEEVWGPKNYDGTTHGITNVHQALIHSYNIATARIGFFIRPDYLTAYARKMGVRSHLDSVPSMTLGSNGLHLYEMVAAYATFANLGTYKKPMMITQITDRNDNVLEKNIALVEEPKSEWAETSGIQNLDALNRDLFLENLKFIESDKLELSETELKILYGREIPPGKVMTEQTAYLMTDLMKGVVRMGTGSRIGAKYKGAVAGKTGTSNEATDTWFIGFTPTLSAGVWVGYDELKPIGKGETGGTTAAPIFLDFLQNAGLDPSKEFPKPQDIDKKDTALLAGGSAVHADAGLIPTVSWEENSDSVDNAADFMEADREEVTATDPAPEEIPN